MQWYTLLQGCILINYFDNDTSDLDIYYLNTAKVIVGVASLTETI